MENSFTDCSILFDLLTLSDIIGGTMKQVREYISYDRFRELLRGALPEDEAEWGMIMFLRLNEIEVSRVAEDGWEPEKKAPENVSPLLLKQSKGA